MTASGATIDLGTVIWEKFNIPGGQTSVALARLATDPDGGFTVLVRFPAGWHRPESGSYNVSEEFLVLAGSIEIGDVVYGANEHVHVPASANRGPTHVPAGALILARFSGPPRWTDSPASNVDHTAVGQVHGSWYARPAKTSPLGPMGWQLLRNGVCETWVIDHVPENTVVPTGIVRAHIWDFATSRYHQVPAGVAIPVVWPGPAWARLIH